MTVILEERLAAELKGPAGPIGNPAQSAEFVAGVLAAERRRAQRHSVGAVVSTLVMLAGLGYAVWANQPSVPSVSIGSVGEISPAAAQPVDAIVVSPGQSGRVGLGGALRVVLIEMAPAFIIGAVLLMGLAKLTGIVRRQRQLPRWRRRGFRLVCAGVFLTVAAFQISFDAHYVPSAAMSPTLEPGDRVLLTPGHGQLSIGDIVVYRPGGAEGDGAGFFAPAAGTVADELEPPRPLPTAPGTPPILPTPSTSGDNPPAGAQTKRVMGLAGDVVEIRDGKLTINDRPVVGWVGSDSPILDDMAPVTVPEGELFLLGDNLSGSRDSRVDGTVPVDDVVGTVKWRTGSSR